MNDYSIFKLTVDFNRDMIMELFLSKIWKK